MRGFVRNKVWDHLHGYERTPLTDIDVIYFDQKDFDEIEADSDSTKKELEYQEVLAQKMPNQTWSVTNQARMHLFQKRKKPYLSSTEGLSEWVETATCVGVNLDNVDQLRLITPHGIEDLVKLLVVPTITTEERIKLFHGRIEKKKWLTKWPKLKVVIR